MHKSMNMDDYVKLGQTIIDNNAPATSKDEQAALHDLEEYMEAAKHDRGTDKNHVWAGFVGWMTFAKNRWPSTTHHRLEFLKRNKVDPWNIQVEYQKIEERRITAGVLAFKGRTGPKYKRSILVDADMQSILTAECPPGIERRTHLLWKCHFWFGCATGNRAGHYGDVRRILLKEDRMLVWWGPRKVHIIPPNDCLTYFFSWSIAPPAEVKCILEALENIPPLSNKTNRAASMNKWLEKITSDHKVTSTCGRIRMSTQLAEKVLDGKLHSEAYRILLDHSLKTALRYYQRHS